MEPRPHERGNGCCSVGQVRRKGTSMEPRPHERGNTPFRTERCRFLVELQWSHVLTNVETDRARHGGGPCPFTSMEPRPHERGNLGAVELAARQCMTSMEPRPHERGNAAKEELRAEAEATSMEPRPHERGNQDVP